MKSALKLLAVLFIVSCLAACGEENTSVEDKAETDKKVKSEETIESKDTANKGEAEGDISAKDLAGEWNSEEGTIIIDNKNEQITLTLMEDEENGSEINFKVDEIKDRTIYIEAIGGEGLGSNDLNRKGAFELSEDGNQLTLMIMIADEMEDDLVLTRK